MAKKDEPQESGLENEVKQAIAAQAAKNAEFATGIAAANDLALEASTAAAQLAHEAEQRSTERLNKAREELNQRIKAEWYLTAEHRTAKWEYWITRDGWDPTKPLSRAQLESEPFMVFDWPHPDGFWTAHKPTKGVAHWVQLPAHKRGYHVIYAIWEVADTDNSFYQACDVEFVAA